MIYIHVDKNKRKREEKKRGVIPFEEATKYDRDFTKIGKEIHLMRRHGESRSRIDRELGSEANKILEREKKERDNPQEAKRFAHETMENLKKEGLL